MHVVPGIERLRYSIPTIPDVSTSQVSLNWVLWASWLWSVSLRYVVICVVHYDWSNVTQYSKVNQWAAVLHLGVLIYTRDA